MRNTAIILAALAAYSEARGGLSAAYSGYAARYGKQTTNTHDARLRQANYDDTTRVIDEINRDQAIHGGATAGHNQFSDMTAAEKHALMGRAHTNVRTSLPMTDRRHAALGSNMNIDHAASGVMHAIKDQGLCGSCYSFGAMTALEGGLAIQGGYTNPPRISEQEGVDCTGEFHGKNYNNNGCGGGLEYNHWDFGKDNGLLLDAEYPYVAKEQNCKRDKVDSRVAVTNITGWRREEQSVADMVSRLQTTPIAIGINASCGAFMNYKSGIITEKQCPPAQMDHSVVIVGYASGEDDGDDGDDDGDDGDDGEDRECVVTKYWYRCAKKSRASGERYWKVQNSWGVGWGEQGYGRIEMAEGRGVGCTNCDATSPTLG